MANLTEHITQIKAAIKALEAQRSVLGDDAVDLSLKALQQQISDLETSQTAATQSKGERRQTTILFSDLSGYTAMGEKLDPEDVQELMNRIKTEAIRIVEHHEGTVNQFVGDEILALFGIPIAHEDDPVRAVKAALELHDMVRKLSEEVEPLIGRPLTMHSGINTGLIVTAIADVRDGKIALTGDTVNTGARLLALAKEDEILISPQTHDRISPFFKTEALDPQAMKGKAKPMIPYRILGETTISTRIEAAEQRGFTTYIGREEELATLNACLEKAIQGEGQVVTIKGEAGLGKSRLIYEFLKEINDEKIIILEGRCQSYGVSSPYLPFLDALRKDLGMRTEDTPAELHEKVVSRLTVMDSSLERYIPVFLHLLSIPSEKYPLPEELKGEKLKQEIEEGLVLINTLNKKQLTKVWILEDWHWVDDASNETFMRHMDIMASLQMMVVLLHRPEYTPELKHCLFHTAIELKGINEQDVESMIQGIYAVDQVPEGFAAQIVQHSGGNPFFIEELCNLLKEDETVMIEEGRIILHKAIEQITFPQSVQAVIRTKLDRLYDESREVINLASVIGRDFLKPILGQITIKLNDLSKSLDNLKTAELIRQLENLPEITYQFKHAITQQVTYQTLLIKRRTLLHRLVGETIEALYPKRLEEQFEILAYHYSKSSDLEKAIHYLDLAGDKAARNYSIIDARTFYKEALELIDAEPNLKNEDMAAWKTKRIEISLKWAQISHYAAPEEFLVVLETSLSYAEELKDESKIAHLNYWFAQRNVLTGDLKNAIAYFSLSIELAEKLNDKALLAQACAAIGRVYFFEAEYLKSNESVERGILLLEELNEKNDVAYASGILCGSYGLTGDIKKALSHGEHAIKLSEETGDLSRKANAHVWLGSAYLSHGNWGKAIEASKLTIEIAQPFGEMVLVISGTTLLGYSLFMNGRHKEGLLKMKKSVEMLEESKIYLLYPMLYGMLAYCCAQKGLMEEAEMHANKCMKWSPKGWKGWEGLGYYALALVKAEKTASDPKEVDETIKKGLQLCKERGLQPYLAQGYFEYGLILLKRNNKNESLKYLSKATEIFTKLNMTWWLEQAKGMEKTLG